jgi:hypothetical protein
MDQHVVILHANSERTMSPKRAIAIFNVIQETADILQNVWHNKVPAPDKFLK